MLSYPVMWTRRGWAARLLLPLAWLFGAVVALRRALYRAGWLNSTQLPVPVVVVGNITVGGTGKTPLVLWLAERLRDAGHVPGIVSRGYGGSATAPRAVTAADDPAECGDEPVLLARASRAAVWIGRDRAAAGRALLDARPECNVILCDDGLQHYRLHRDVEIAVIDGERGLGNGYLLPAGPLRESAARLTRVHAVVVRGTATALPASDACYTMELRPREFVNLKDRGQRADAGYFRGRKVHAVAAIGNPRQFFDALTRLGVAHRAHVFPDHHAYTAGDLDFPDCDAIVMTEKDAVKCQLFADARLWALATETVVDERLAQHVMQHLHRNGSNGHP